MTPDPGIYPGIPAADYHRWSADSFSSLKNAGRTLAHWRWAQTHPTEPTAAMELGTAVHMAVLEPERFGREYVTAPDCDRRTKAGKEEWARFQLEYPHATVLKADDYDACAAMGAAVWTHPLASELLKGPGANEVSALWIDPDTGAPSKCRPDRITTHDGWTHVIDVKTTKDASPDGFRRAIASFDYHMQAAHYLDGLDVLQPRERRFTFIAIESGPPYCVAVYTLDAWALQQGREEIAEAKARVVAARASGDFPGYPNEIIELGLPVWRQRREEV